MKKCRVLDRYVHFNNNYGILFTGRKKPGETGFQAVPDTHAWKYCPGSMAARCGSKKESM